MSPARWCHVLVVIAACGGPDSAAPAAPTSEGDKVASDDRLTNEYLLALVQMPIGRSSDSEPVPSVFDDSQALSLQAHQAYQARDYALAADGFVRAALVLRVPSGEYLEAAAANRAKLFLNAAYSWRSAGTPAVGREVLTRLRKEQRATAADLQKALAVLH